MKYLLVIVLLFTGCTVNQSFVTAVETNWAAIKPEYSAYVEADSTFTAADKELRYDVIKAFDAAIAEAKQ